MRSDVARLLAVCVRTAHTMGQLYAFWWRASGIYARVSCRCHEYIYIPALNAHVRRWPSKNTHTHSSPPLTHIRICACASKCARADTQECIISLQHIRTRVHMCVYIQLCAGRSRSASCWEIPMCNSYKLGRNFPLPARRLHRCSRHACTNVR